ncbi:5-carboxymethyl-2-hydroxymuconate Delta-isomerase [Streptomyces cavernae]|uniref:5-carboxymethyl-2-hydroxymuconate Delta-isomerase n=1 Tax=Streptomyces cavernae TaxID=2259034 RepID=UPI000FEC1D61|nr:5-carboxymethyl-2-hydroxymuconate Delta-isomerase [Streptomyces cavernae]
MPQITVDYSESLADAFDRRGFAGALHPVVVETTAAKLEACKTQFRRTEDTVVGGSDTGEAIVHVTIGLLAGRTDETKAKLTGQVLQLVREYLKPAEGLGLHVSAETRDLDPSYQKFDS